MKLLALVTLLLPSLTTAAQTRYQLLGDLQRLVVAKPAPVYLSLADTATTSLLQLEPGQVATIKAVVNTRWLVLWQGLDYKPLDMYVRIADLAGASPYKESPVRRKP